MKTKLKDIDAVIKKELKDPDFTAAYLNEHLSYKGPHRQDLLLEALQHIAEARGITKLSRRSGLSRRTLYYAFSRTGNPTLDTFLVLIDCLGMRLRFDADRSRDRVRLVGKRRKTA